MAEQKGSLYYNTPYKFNGKELDQETGLYYYGARYYDPRISIWISVDPLAEHSPNKSPYHYCSNNPINRTDPTGMCDDPNCNHGAIRRGWDAIGRFFGAWGYSDNSKNFIKQNKVVIAGPIEETGPMLSQDNSTPEQRAENKAKYDAQQFAENTVNNHDNLGSPYTQLRVGQGVVDGIPIIMVEGIVADGLKIFTLTDEIVESLVKVNAVEGDVMIFSSKIGGETIEGITNFAIEDGKLYLNQLHLQGSSAGNVGRSVLWDMAKDLGKQYNVGEVIIQGGKRTTGKYAGQIPSPIRIKVTP